jgi:putative transposase
VRMLRDLLVGKGITAGRKRMTTLMRRMRITALYRKPNTSKKTPGGTIYPYLLRTLPVARYHPVLSGLGDGHQLHPDGPGFRLLAAVID